MQGLRKQSGMAGLGLVLAFMILSVVVAIAVKESWREHLDMSRYGHRWAGLQARAYESGAEQLAELALVRDAEQNQSDNLQEDWAQRLELPTDDGFLQAQLQDAQAKLNLNSLADPYKVTAQGALLPGAQKYSASQRRFIRLVQAIPLDDEGTEYYDLQQAEALLDAVKDWIDPDSDVSGFGGAEGDYYSALDLPLTINNGPMISVSELRNVREMDPRLYRGLLPYVTALDPAATLNVNTMQGRLAQCFNRPDDLTPMSVDDGAALLEEIQLSPLENLQDFSNLPVLATLVGTASGGVSNLDTSGLGVSSSYFILDSTIAVGDHISKGNSLLMRKDNKAYVIRHSDTNF